MQIAKAIVKAKKKLVLAGSE